MRCDDTVVDGQETLERKRLCLPRGKKRSCAFRLLVCSSFSCDILREKVEKVMAYWTARQKLSLLPLLLLFGPFQCIAGLVVPPSVVSFACGGVAGAVGAIAVYPVDYLKTQLQTEEGAAKYRNGQHAFRSIVEERGIIGLYRGLGPQVCGVAPEKALKIFVNDAAKAGITSACGGVLPMAGEALAGFTAGCCQVVVTNPLEAVKVRMQTSTEGSAIGVIKALGLRGLYNGADACLLRDGTFSLILFPIYAHAKELLGVADDASGMSAALALGLAGLVAAAPAAALSTPFDVVKTRVQAACRQQSAEDLECDLDDVELRPAMEPAALPTASRITMVASSTEPPRLIDRLSDVDGVTGQRPTLSPLAAAAEIMREEGAAALFSGCLERVLRSAPQFAVTLSCADLLKHSAHAAGWM